MSVALPEELKYGYVAGRFILAVGDTSADLDTLPDGKPDTGVITFTPVGEQIFSTNPVPTLVTKATVSFSLDSEGYLSDAHGNKTISLVAGIYNVAYGLSKTRKTGHLIEVTEAHTSESPLWLPSAGPYIPPPNTTLQVLELPSGGAQGQVYGWDNGKIGWFTPPEGGGSQGPSHVSIQASGNVTLPTEHPVLTIRADDPATLSLPEAPDGTVVTIHVAHGWENLTWDPGITVTGDSATTETWVVLVRKEGGWSALVSGSGGGGISGHGRPDGISWPYGEPGRTRGAPVLAPLGTVYTDLDQTDGAVQWTVTDLGYIWWYDSDTGTYPEIEDGPIWEVTIGSTEWRQGSNPYYPNPLTPPAGYDAIEISARRKGDWVDVEIFIMPSGIGQGVPVTVPPVNSYFLGPPENFAPADYGYVPIELNGDPDFIAAVGEPPQAMLSDITLLTIPSFEIGAFTAGEYPYMSMSIKEAYRIKDHLAWPSQMEKPDTPPDPGDGGGGV